VVNKDEGIEKHAMDFWGKVNKSVARKQPVRFPDKASPSGNYDSQNGQTSTRSPENE